MQIMVNLIYYIDIHINIKQLIARWTRKVDCIQEQCISSCSITVYMVLLLECVQAAGCRRCSKLDWRSSSPFTKQAPSSVWRLVTQQSVRRCLLASSLSLSLSLKFYLFTFLVIKWHLNGLTGLSRLGKAQAKPSRAAKPLNRFYAWADLMPIPMNLHIEYMFFNNYSCDIPTVWLIKW